MMRPLVLATDFSPHADEALRFARRFIAANQPVHLVHCRTADAAETEAPLAEAAARSGHDPEAVVLAEPTGTDAAHALAAYAAAVDAEMVVVGTRGLRGGRRLLLGSVAEDFIRIAPCNVLVVPLDATLPWSERPTRNVLTPVDFSRASAVQVTFAQQVITHLGAAEMDLFHVVDLHDYARYRQGRVEIEERIEGELARLGARRRSVRPHLAYGTPSAEIVRWAELHDSDLVVLASARLRGMGRRLLGSVCARVMRQLDRPILLVHADAAIRAVETAPAPVVLDRTVSRPSTRVTKPAPMPATLRPRTAAPQPGASA